MKLTTTANLQSSDNDHSSNMRSAVKVVNSDDNRGTYGEFKHEVRQFQKPYDNQQAEQISLMV
ncbi:hypothetical protein LV48_03276 [Acinetobacter baumannii]|nr:hypothetical protein LV48_03276 [Acinetobacter baumannii]